MSVDLSHLNDSQRAAAECPGHVLVVAGPGCGKTETMGVRAAHLLVNHPQAKLAAVTFTKDAAAELRHRILQRGQGVSRRLSTGTFHALCIQQLKAAGVPVRIMSDALTTQILSRLYQERSVDFGKESFEDVRAKMDALKCKLGAWTPDEANPLHTMYLAYEAALQQHGRIDFADMLKKSVLGMREGTIAPLDIQYLIVDEFQDADELQLEWTLAHARSGVIVTCVGDDDQSIYGWRGACGYNAMMHFQAATQAAHVVLDTTYRCRPQIVQAASRCIAHNAARVDKQLRTSNPHRGWVRVQRFATETEEATAILNAVTATERGTWGILARTGRQLDVVEEALRGTPYRRMGGTPFWSKPGPALYLEALSSLVEGSMRGVDALLSAFGARSTLIDRLHAACGAGSERSALERFASVPLGRGSAPDVQCVLSLQRHCVEWLDCLDQDRPALVTTGLADWMQAQLPKKLFRGIRLSACAETLNKRSSPLAQRILLLRQQIAQDGGAGPTLMTLHKSKGLEWDFVWIVRCEDGLLPYKDSPREEERRLCYVGMTRAREGLTMSFTRGTGRMANVPSPFIDEAGLAVSLGSLEAQLDRAAA